MFIAAVRCDGQGRVLWTSEIASALGAAEFAIETNATLDWTDHNSRRGLLFDAVGDTGHTGCNTTSAAALVDLPFEVDEMLGDIHVLATGAFPPDDDYAWGTSWVPAPYQDAGPVTDCPGGVMVGVAGLNGQTPADDVFKAPGTWGPNWSGSGTERIVAGPGSIGVTGRQLRVAVADHSKLAGAEQVFVSWELWLPSPQAN